MPDATGSAISARGDGASGEGWSGALRGRAAWRLTGGRLVQAGEQGREAGKGPTEIAPAGGRPPWWAPGEA